MTARMRVLTQRDRSLSSSPFVFAFWHACQSFSGVVGMSRCAPGMASGMAPADANIVGCSPKARSQHKPAKTGVSALVSATRYGRSTQPTASKFFALLVVDQP